MLKSISGILLAAAFLLSCTSEASESQIRKAAVVRLAKVEHKEIALPIRNSGKLAAKKEVRLSFKTGGIIHSFYADEGDLVKKGQKLAMLDMDEVNAYLKQAESAYVKAKRDQQRVLNLYADSAASLEQKQNVEIFFTKSVFLLGKEIIRSVPIVKKIMDYNYFFKIKKK